MGWYEWIDWAKDKDQWKALVSTVINFGAAQNVAKSLSS
jgi:hypothetical protein